MVSTWAIRECVACHAKLPSTSFPSRSHVCHLCSTKGMVCSICAAPLTEANRRKTGLQCRPCHNARGRRRYVGLREAQASSEQPHRSAVRGFKGVIETGSTVRYSIQEAAERSGITTSELRIWQLRYKWPNPERLANGYRVYSRALIEQLTHAKAMRAAGYAVGQLIQDGLYIGRELEQAAERRPPRAVFQLPDDDRAVIREELAVALERKVMAIVARELASLGIYPPARRAAIVRSVEAADRFHGGCFKPLIDRYVHRMPSITSRSA